MKRAGALGLALLLGASSAGAQVAPIRASLSAPALAASVPAPAASALVVSPLSFVAAPSLTAAPLALSAPAAAPAAAVALSLSAAPAVAATPSDFSTARAAAPPARADALAAAAPSFPAGSVFDGSSSRENGAAAVDGRASAPGPSAAASDAPARRPSFFRLGPAHKGLLVGSVAAAAVPVLWSAAPGAKLGYLEATALVFALVAVAVALVARSVRRPAPRAAKPPRRWASALLGLGLGVMIGATPTVFESPLIERAGALYDAVATPHDRAALRAVPGHAMQDEALRVLSANPVGREVLDRLRDRGGVVRLPPFFVSRQSGFYARHNKGFGVVEIPYAEIADRGWTVDQFLADPALQRRLVRETASTVAHELTHEAQARLSPFRREFWTLNVMEEEYEAFLVQHAFVHAALAVDPRAPLRAVDLDRYRAALDDLDGWLKSLDASYPQNTHYDYPRWRGFYASVKSGWPAHRAAGYLLLARRELADSPALAAADLAKARAAAAEAGLPPPTLE